MGGDNLCTTIQETNAGLASAALDSSLASNAPANGQLRHLPTRSIRSSNGVYNCSFPHTERT